MRIAQRTSPINTYEFKGELLPVLFVSTLVVTEGVLCDVYQFIGDSSKDLGIIRIKPNCKTPLQKVLKGNKTIEGYISGKGKLTIGKLNGIKEIYRVGVKSEKSVVVSVKIGQTMQWEADAETGLVVYEICYPPYEDGRYENIG